MGQNKRNEDGGQFTLGFVIFSIITVIVMSFLLAIIQIPFPFSLLIAGYIGWNLRRFYFGPWQVIQTATLISLNNWLKRK